MKSKSNLMGGGILNKALSKTKKIVVVLLLLIGIVEVSAISSNEVTYENEGISETLTNTIDTLYKELKEYRTNGSVTSNEMLEGSTGYAKGKLINGSIPSKGSTTYTPGVNNQVINKGQYLSEEQVILGDSNLKPENIKGGIEIFGVQGTLSKCINDNIVIVVDVRQSIIGHTPPTEYRDIKLSVVKDDKTIFSSGWQEAGSGTDRVTYDVPITEN